MDSIGVVLNMISSSMRTEELLQELKRSNAELEAQASELEEKAKLLEIKNHEVELASLSLEEKAEQLSLISKYKSEFLANMSHELRTPLNSLLILSKMLSDNKDHNLNGDQVKYASTIHSAGCDLLALINEILDLSKVEAGKMPMLPSNIELREVKDLLDQTFRPVAEHKGLGFSIELHHGTPRTMFTDANRLQQILKNLLSNALKFTAKGRVTLDIAPVEEGIAALAGFKSASSPIIRFSVTDTGIGIPKEKQKLIFEAFQQADGTTSRKYGGTGLGLTISREIARLLGGVIQVESMPGKGSVFHLYIPQTFVGSEATQGVSELEVVQPIPPLPIDADFKDRRVLIVDDDMRNVYTMTSVLESYGMKVSFAENGRQAIVNLQEQEIDLVLMDTMMPEMDGLEATTEIRKIARFKNLPIISLTAKAMKGDREKCLAAGASDYITKPVDTEQLLSLMHIWLAKRELN